MKSRKQRLDQLLVDRGLVETRSKAQAIVMAGQVFTGERKLDKPGESLPDDVVLEIRRSGPGWVSRGALKLIEGLDRFGIDPAGLTCLDVGASTGGFTEVLLSRGAVRIYAVDVGYGQLAQKLRNDPRVVNMERTNARHLTTAQVPDRIDLLVCDASFIGLSTVLPSSMAFCPLGAHAVVLIKPQFEVGPERVGKGGVVRDPALHEEVCTRYREWFTMQGWEVLGIVPSPITGPAGNIEFLLGARRSSDRQACPRSAVIGRMTRESQQVVSRVEPGQMLAEPAMQLWLDAVGVIQRSDADADGMVTGIRHVELRAAIPAEPAGRQLGRGEGLGIARRHGKALWRQLDPSHHGRAARPAALPAVAVVGKVVLFQLRKIAYPAAQAAASTAGHPAACNRSNPASRSMIRSSTASRPTWMRRQGPSACHGAAERDFCGNVGMSRLS